MGVANAALLTLVGNGLIGRQVVAVFRDPALSTAIEEGYGTAVNVQYARAQTGSTRPLSFDVSARPLGNGVLVTMTDRTEAQDADLMRRDFVANVSHELRTPITAMSGFIETLQGPAKDDPQARARFLDIMAQEVKRMHALVDELGQLSRLEAEERSRPTDRVDIVQIADQAVAAITPIAQKAGADLRLRTPERPLQIAGDAVQLQQVITNLLENAIKYGASDNQITVEVDAITYQPKLRAKGVAVSVRDQGIGIAAHYIARLTERFFRVDDHRSRDAGGTGLGLAIVKHIVSRHRGRMVIESTPDQGSTFTVILPVGVK